MSMQPTMQPTTMSQRLWTLRRLLLISRPLLLACFGMALLFFLCATAAQAGQHRGGTGPGQDPRDYYPPPTADFGGYVWGYVVVAGEPVANAEITMSYGDKSITATTLFVPEIEAFPIYMFGIRPATELGATYNTTVTISARYRGQSFGARAVRLLPDANNELEVAFGEIVRPTPPPILPPAPTVALTDVVAAQLVAAGGVHTCAVIRGGAWCWGRNDFYGQLGDGDFTMQNKPVAVVGLTSGVKSIAAGETHTCALMTTGTVKCWGNNQWGVLGQTSDPGYSPTPMAIPDIHDAIAIAAGNHQSCALLVDRKVQCWGWNAFGKLGIGSKVQSVFTPTYVIAGATHEPLGEVQSIALSFNHHTCALVQGGLKCWGGNAPLGNGSGSAFSSTVPVDIFPAGSGIVAVDAGEKETCFVKRDNSVWCWGGENNAVFAPITPTLISTLPLSTTKITVGNNFACALLVDGSIRCWGGVQADGENYGYLGTTTIGTSLEPIEIPGIGRNIVDIAAGSRHACAMTANGEVRCWGYNQFGQLGDGARPSHPLPQPLAVMQTGDPIAALAPGGHHNCLLTTSGSVQCWGANQYGQIGTGTTSLVETDAHPINLPLAAIAIGSGYQHSCAVTSDGAVWCWGRNQLGQLGNGKAIDSASPVQVVRLDGPVVELTVGRDHACVRLASGAVQCWGDNKFRQLGNGIQGGIRMTPTHILSQTIPAIAVAAGEQHSCALLNGGVAQCWGLNHFNNIPGVLGVGITNTYSAAPMTVIDLVGGVTAISAGQDATCAVQNGGVKCWGNLWRAEDKSNSAQFYAQPMSIAGLGTGILDVAIAQNTGCVLLSEGAVQCWGDNRDGLVGVEWTNGPRRSASPPVTVTGLQSGVTALSSSTEDSAFCAVLNDGTARCWGWNDFGQLGSGAPALSPAPVQATTALTTTWTYMLYLAGDNDLSSYLNNIARYLDQLPSSDSLNIAILFDGQGESDSYLWIRQPGGSYRLNFDKWKLAELTSNMGKSNTLAAFIQWASLNLPAEHYYLSIANHGRGTTGTSWDTQNGGYAGSEWLTPTEIHNALDQATRHGAWRLDIIHFDSCLMALMETAYQVKEFADYMIASENLTAAFYPYDRYARLVQKSPAILPRELAVGIANEYFNYPYLQINHQPRTISVLNLQQIEPVNTALNEVAVALQNSLPASRDTILAARRATQKYDSSPDDGHYFTITENDAYLDLYDLANELDQKNLATVDGPAQALRGILEMGGANSFIVSSQAESGVDGLMSGATWTLTDSHGVAIYFPSDVRNRDEYDAYVNDQLFTFTKVNHWSAFLQDFYNGQPTQNVDTTIPPVLKPTKPITDHCPASVDSCLWGTVMVSGTAVSNAVVTVKSPAQALTMRTAFLTGTEALPIFAFPIPKTMAASGTQLTVSAEYADHVQTLPVDFLPNPVTGEQEVSIVLGKPITSVVTQTVAINQAFVWPANVVQPNTTVVFHAGAKASDDTPIVRYLWESSRGVELGSTSTVHIEACQLSEGEYSISVQAISATGIKSEKVHLTLTVTAACSTTRIFLPLIHRQ